MIKEQPILRISLKYGIMGAILSMVLFLILYYSGKHPALIPALFDFRIILFPIVLVFSIRDFKLNFNEGILHFWQGMSIGLLDILIFSLLMMFFIMVFGGLLETEYVHEYISGMQQQILTDAEIFSNSVGKDAYTKTLEILPSTTIFDLALDYFLKSWPLGLFLIIIISLILRKKQ